MRWSDIAATSTAATSATISTLGTGAKLSNYCTTGTYATITTSDLEYGLSMKESTVKIECEDGESRNLREYVKWVMIGCPSKNIPMPTPKVKQEEMMI